MKKFRGKKTIYLDTDLNLYNTNVNFYKDYIFHQDFLEKYVDELDLKYLIKYQKLSMSILSKIVYKLTDDNWRWLFLYQNLSPYWVEKNFQPNDKNCSYYMYKIQFSLDFLKKNLKYLSLYEMARTQKLDDELIRKVLQNNYFEDISKNQYLSEEMIDHVIPLLNSRTYLYSRFNITKENIINNILLKNNLSEDFLSKHKDEFSSDNWKKIFSTYKLSIDFIKKFRSNIKDFKILLKNKNILRKDKNIIKKWIMLT